MMRYFARHVVPVAIFALFLGTASAQRVSPIKVNPGNAALYRDSLNELIFGTHDFPYDILPDSFVTNVPSLDLYDGFPYTSILYPAGNLDSIDKVVVKFGDNITDFPQKAKVYLFHPHVSNGKLFVYHSGHCAGIATAEDVFENNFGVEPGLVIPALLAEGYTVLAVPTVNYQFTYPNGLACGFNNHDALFVDNHYQHPLAFFFRPVIASLNLLGRSNYNAIYMCGLSGGGWTTSIYPALDSSISYSFPIAGSWPVPLTYAFNSLGDYEQSYPPLFGHLLDYHELYTLACIAPARKMLQINNRYDACCFDGAEAHVFYVDSVAAALRGTGGLFKFYLDETSTSHQITPRALEVMFTFLRNDTAFLLNEPADSAINGQAYEYDIKNNFALTTAPDNSTLRFSLLKAPSWLSLDAVTGRISGNIPAQSIIARPDTVSFKAEDTTGRFVLFNYIIKKKRTTAYFFTAPGNSQVVYFLPGYANSISAASPLIVGSFYFNNPQLAVLSVAIQQNSVIKLTLNADVSPGDFIGYNGFDNANALTYTSGIKVDDSGLTEIKINAVKENYALAGMIRFNTDSNKFEYFNGLDWVNMN